MNEYPCWWAGVQAFDAARGSAPSSAAPPIPNRRCDVAIVGAGYTGLSAARHLASTGASTLVLERETVGWGASSRNGGQILPGFNVEPATLVARHGEANARRLFEISIESIAHLEAVIAQERIECELEASGHLQAAVKPSHFESFRSEQALLTRVFNHRVDLVSRDQQRSELGSDRYHGLLVDERSRGLNPARYVAGLADAARRAGASIAEHTGVTQIRKAGDRWRVTTAHGDIDAAHVVIASNGYGDTASGSLQRRLVPIGSYIIATEPLAVDDANALLPRRRMAFDSKHFLYYFRVTADRRLVFGGRAEFSRPTDASARRAAEILRRGMVSVFPQLADVRIEFAWGGNVAFTRDRMPHAGTIDGMHYAAGYCGHGVAMATYLGELVARQLAGESITHPLFDPSSRAFPAIPLYNGNPWFLPFAGLYYRVMDVLH